MNKHTRVHLGLALVALVAALHCLTVLPAHAGGGEILFLNSFEGSGNVPQFVPIDDQAGVSGRRLVVDVDTSDPADQNGVLFSLIDEPAGMTIQSATGLIDWTPTASQVGVDVVTVRAEDLEGLANTLNFNVEIVDSSASPWIEPIPDQTVSVGESYLYQVQASDPDVGDLLDFALVGTPVGMVIDPVTGEIAWLPQAGDIGLYTIRVRVSDPSGAANEAIYTLRVVADNLPPIIEAVPDRGAAPGVPTEIQLVASDPDGGSLTYQLAQRPTGMVVAPDTGQIRWTPTLQQLGPHAVTAVVRDTVGATAETSFEVQVDLNRPPVAIDDGGYRVERGDTLAIAAPGVLANDSDPNSDPLSAQLVSGPVRGTLQLNADGSFDYTPDNPAGTIGFELDWAAEVSGGGGNWGPIIANMDQDAQSEILVNLASGCCQRELRSYDGLEGVLEWDAVFFDRELSFDSQPAVADIDLDGMPELIVIGGEPDSSVTRESMLYAFEHDGTIKWLSEDFPQTIYRNGTRLSNFDFFGSALSIADLDQDGFPEIVAAPNGGPVQFTVWDHEGQLLRTVSSDRAVLNDQDVRVTLVDLDLDGDLEVVVGGTAWHHDGTFIWNLDGNFANTSLNDFPIVANLDDDPYPELIRTRGASIPDQRGDLLAINHDGTVKWEVIASTLGTSDTPLAAADLNQDGFADVIRLGPPFEGYVEARDGRDGSLLWTSTVESGRGGVTVFDMNRDGLPEVIVFDPSSDLYVLNGQDGSELLFFSTVDSGVIRPPFSTAPVFADIDADGQAELVLSMGETFGNTPTVSVYQSPLQDWGPMRSIWNEAMYRVTNVNDDLTIPTREPQHWLQPGLNQATVNERLPEARLEEQDRFHYRASDGLLTSNVATVDISILPPNAPPRILSEPRRLASPGFEYVYRALAVDADPGETLSWSLVEGPAGMTVDPQGTVRWTPTVGDLGPNAVILEVTDSIGVSAYQNFLLQVEDPVLVPELSGLTEAEAVDAVQTAGLVVDPLRTVFSDSIPVGQVVAQDPAAGTSAAAGDPVQVDLSLGPVPLQVPDLIALRLNDAIAELLDQGFSLGTLDFVNDPLQPVDTVLIQDPAPSSARAAGSAIDLTVSGGPRALITISPTIIPAGQSAEVSVSVRDVDGTPLDPQPAVTLGLDFEPGDLSGTLPSLAGTTVTTAADSQGAFRIRADFTSSGAESVSTRAAITQAISDGEGANVFSEFFEQLSTFERLIAELIIAVETNDGPAILAIDSQLADLLEAIDLPRLNGLTPIAPEGGVPPSPTVAAQNGFPPGADDAAYRDAALDLFATLEQAEQVIAEGIAPDRVIFALNQELSDVASAAREIEPDVYGVLDASEILIAILGTRAPRMLTVDIQAVRQSLRDTGIITASGQVASSRFTLPGIMTATQIRSKIIKDVYAPYLGDVARAMGTLIAADLLQAYANGGSIVGVITGASQSIQVFNVDNSVIEGLGFDTLLPEGNSVTIVGPELIDAVVSIIDRDLPQAQDLKDLNKIKDAVQAEIDRANNLVDAVQGAVSAPDAVLRGCLFDNRPECRQLLYSKGFDSVYKANGGLSLPAPVIFIVYNLAGGSFGVFVAPFVPTRED